MTGGLAKLTERKGMPRGRRNVRDYGIVVAFLLLFIGLSLATRTFLTQQNLVNLLDQQAIFAVLACGATLAIVTGVFDLSISAILALSAIISVSVAGVAGTPVGFAAGIATGAVLGIINGVVVHYGKVNAFIATLASSIVFRGLALVISGGNTLKTSADGYDIFGVRSPIFGMTYSSVVMIAVAIVTAILLAKTVYGRSLYAVGGNMEAARLSGIRTDVVRVSIFMISGMLAALGGLLVTSRFGTAQANTGIGWELTAIAASVVGGTSILGGEGAIWRAMLGIFILALIGNGMNLLTIDSTFQQVVQGLLILFAVILDQFLRRRR